MTKKNEEHSEVQNFEVEEMLSDHPKHKRYVFSFDIEGNEFKGHFHEEEITWMHPHPKQIYGDEKVELIENSIHDLLCEHGHFVEIPDIEMLQVFQDRPHERSQVSLTVRGEEFKGFVHNGEIQWFHPHPQQKLKDEHVEEIETEIHETVAKQAEGSNE